MAFLFRPVLKLTNWEPSPRTNWNNNWLNWRRNWPNWRFKNCPDHLCQKSTLSERTLLVSWLLSLKTKDKLSENCTRVRSTNQRTWEPRRPELWEELWPNSKLPKLLKSKERSKLLSHKESMLSRLKIFFDEKLVFVWACAWVRWEWQPWRSVFL